MNSDQFSLVIMSGSHPILARFFNLLVPSTFGREIKGTSIP